MIQFNGRHINIDHIFDVWADVPNQIVYVGFADRHMHPLWIACGSAENTTKTLLAVLDSISAARYLRGSIK